MTELKVFNGTQHEINVYNISQTTSVQDGRKLIVNEGETPLLTVVSGKNLNCVKSNAKAPNWVTNIPLVGAVEFTSHDELPEGYDIYIVSNLYRSAVKELGGDTSKLATVNGVVYASEADMRPCGCTSLAVG